MHTSTPAYIMAYNADTLPDREPRSLAESINTAISSSHTVINRLILTRMPRAMPPQVDNPSTYVTGLLHFGAVYIAFESLWQNILGIHTDIAPFPYTYPFHSCCSSSSSGGGGTSPDYPFRESTRPQITQRTRDILEAAYWPNMLRATRVKADIHTITGWPAHVVDDQLRSAGTTGALGTFLKHIKDAVDAKPHLLLAYAYGLYLALLSGGSYIRTELMYVRADFWLAVPEPIRPAMVPCNREPKKVRRHSTFEYDSGPRGQAAHGSSVTLPLSFLDFDTPLGLENPRQQAKDLKFQFKRRFSAAAQALDEREALEIIAESVAIFEHLEAVVLQLDMICGDSGAVVQGAAGGHVARTSKSSPSPHTPTPGFASRLRDSIAVAKGRLLRKVGKPRGTSGSGTDSAPKELEMGQPATTTTTTAYYSPGSSGSSKPLSVAIGGVCKDLQEDDDANLWRDAVLPGEGFRPVRYDDSQLDSEGQSQKYRSGGYDGAADDDEPKDKWQRAVHLCPISRRPTMAGRKNSFNLPLAAIVYDFVVLLGVALLLAAYLYVRRCDGGATPLSAGLEGKAWS